MTEQKSYGQILQTLFQKIIDDKMLTPEQLVDASSDISKSFVEKNAGTLRRDLKRKAVSMLAINRRKDAGFEKRNLQRWRKAFNLVELIWEVAAEVGGKFNEEVTAKPVHIDQLHLLTALIHIHARSMLVASECICFDEGWISGRCPKPLANVA